MDKDIENNLKDLEADENDNKKEDWVFEHPISDERQFIGQVHIQEKPDLIRNKRRRLSNLSNALGFSRNALMKEIFNAGLEVLESQLKTGKRGELAELSDSEAKNWEINQQVRRILEKEAMFKDLAVIYNDLGLESFITFCKKNGIEYEEFISLYSWKSEELKVSQRDRDFLRNFLYEKGEVKVSEIRSAAHLDSVIENEDTDWKRLSKTAERMGITGGQHGFWRIPGKATI